MPTNRTELDFHLSLAETQCARKGTSGIGKSLNIQKNNKFEEDLWYTWNLR